MPRSISAAMALTLLLFAAVALPDQIQQPVTRGPARPFSPAYVLGPDDQIVIHAFEAEEISEKPMQVGPDGLISLPLIGAVRAGGLSVRELEKEVASRLSAFIRHPTVSITVTEYRSQPVSVLGEVNNAGVHELRGETSLLEILSAAGGLKEDAGYRIKIVRRLNYGVIPLLGAASDSTGKFSIAELNVKGLLQASRPEDNIPIKPYDVITIPKAEVVYVVGEVNRSGAFILNDQASMSILQAVSRAEGLKGTALASKARVLRPVPGSPEKKEITVNVAKILRGSAPDMPLYPDDVLFIPNNVTKAFGLRGLEAAINIGSGIAIWRP